LKGKKPINKAGKILNRKIEGAFYGLIKLDLKDLLGPAIPARRTLRNLNQYLG
jgi:hypothetical protein